MSDLLEHDAENTHCRNWIATLPNSEGLGSTHLCGEPVSRVGALYCEGCGGPPSPDAESPLGVGAPPSTQDRIARAAICSDSFHERMLKTHQIDTFESLCLVCAVQDATTDHARSEEILAWAFEVAAIGEMQCRDLALCAVEHPDVFRGRWQAARLALMDERLERARQELRGAYWALHDIRKRCNWSVFESTTAQIASALALLEEIR